MQYVTVQGRRALQPFGESCFEGRSSFCKLCNRLYNSTIGRLLKVVPSRRQTYATNHTTLQLSSWCAFIDVPGATVITPEVFNRTNVCLLRTMHVLGLLQLAQDFAMPHSASVQALPTGPGRCRCPMMGLGQADADAPKARCCHYSYNTFANTYHMTVCGVQCCTLQDTASHAGERQLCLSLLCNLAS